MQAGSYLLVLSLLFNDRYPLHSPKVLIALATAIIGVITFIGVELFVAREPVLAPALLRQKIPVLVGLNNFLVAICNFTVQYFFPMWFQTVQLTSPAIAGGLSAHFELRVSYTESFQVLILCRTPLRCPAVPSLRGMRLETSTK